MSIFKDVLSEANAETVAGNSHHNKASHMSLLL